MLLHRPRGRAAAILIACLFGTNLSYVAAQPHTPGTSQLGGWVYIDRNDDGELAFVNEPNPEYMIGNVLVSLYSQIGPETLVTSTRTDEFGRYFFNNLSPGTYGLKQTQPVEFVDGIDTSGQMQALTNSSVLQNSSVGSMVNNAFNGIVLPANVRGDYFNFGERGLAPAYVSKRFLFGSSPILEFGTPDDPGTLIPEPATLWFAVAAVGVGLLSRQRREYGVSLNASIVVVND
jgi:hypothetical protein